MIETRFNVGMTWYVPYNILQRLIALIGELTTFLPEPLRRSEGCASAVKRILGKIEGETYSYQSMVFIYLDLEWWRYDNVTVILSHRNSLYFSKV